MLHLSVSTRIAVDEPSVDRGFVTWYNVLIHRDTSEEMNDDGGDIDEENEKVEQIGRAQIAIVHVGAVLDSHTTLYDVLDADSSDLEALHSLYFDEEGDWFKDELGCAAGVDLGYIYELMIESAWQGRNIELAVVQRLNTTLAAGCKVLVMPVSSPEEVTYWEQMGFEVSTPGGGEPDHVHLNNAMTHPRVVPVKHPGISAELHEEDRFTVLRDDGDEDAEVEPSGRVVPPVQSMPEASPSRTQGAAMRRAIASRRPARRRR